MSPTKFIFCALPWAALLAAAPLAAKPISFGDGYTAMYEYGAGNMQETQLFYAPRYWYSLGVGQLRLEADNGGGGIDIGYVRANVLVKRWNLPAAQGNVFAWGGLGAARGVGITDSEFAWNTGAQADYETRRVYTSLKSDYQHTPGFSTRMDTAQLGLAPYLHDYQGIATWFLLQARHYSADPSGDIETAALIRLFGARSWGSVWFEGGVTDRGRLQTMFMFNF